MRYFAQNDIYTAVKLRHTVKACQVFGVIKILARCPLYPDVRRELRQVTEAVQKGTSGNLWADALYFKQKWCGIPARFNCVLYIVKRHLTCCYTPCGVKDIFRAKPHFGRGEGIVASLICSGWGGEGAVFIPAVWNRLSKTQAQVGDNLFMRGMLLFWEIINEQRASHGSCRSIRMPHPAKAASVMRCPPPKCSTIALFI